VFVPHGVQEIINVIKELVFMKTYLDFQICCTGGVVFFVDESSALVTTDLEISSASHAG
jgi:hypothetical protein